MVVVEGLEVVRWRWCSSEVGLEVVAVVLEVVVLKVVTVVVQVEEGLEVVM